ncbi:MAG: hypothetical protein ACJ72N_23320 [Labedaea sp.]
MFNARIAESTRGLWITDNGPGWYEEIRDGQRTRWSGKQDNQAGRPPTVTGTDPKVIEAQLSTRHPDWRGANWITFIEETWTRQTVTPAVQAALLRVLSNAPDLTIEGTVTDRAGRTGVAVSAIETHDGVATHRRIPILNPTTGAVLDAEKIALEKLGKPINVPATVGYTLWITTGYVAVPLERP